MVEKNNKKSKQTKKKMSYRKKIVALQVGAITLAVFLLLMVGAVVLTKIFVGEPQNSQTMSSGSLDEQTNTEENHQEQAADNAEADSLDDLQGNSGEGTSQTEEPVEETQSMQPVEEVKITVSMVGDCTLGTDEQFDKSSNFDAFYIVKKDPGYFFQGVKDVFAADDLTVINMEGTLTESNTRQDKTYAFKGAPKYTEIMTAGNIDAANLANNHSKDYGEQSYTYTIQYGMGRQQQVIDNIQSVKEQGAQVVIVSFHWGTEKATYPDDTQKTLAHTAIDNGADLVVGHHPHVLQGIEEYNGKNIVYSLGNFCFGGNRNPADKDTMIFQQTFTFANGELVLDNVKNIIPCSLSSVQEYNDYQPTILEGSESERVLQKIQELSAGL